MASSGLVTATPNSFNSFRVSSLPMKPPPGLVLPAGRAGSADPFTPWTARRIVVYEPSPWSQRHRPRGRRTRLVPRAAAASVEHQLGSVPPERVPVGLEVLGGDEVHSLVEIHLELAAAVAGADPARGVLEKRLHLPRREAYQPLEADGAGKGLLHADRRRELGPHPGELLQHLSTRGALHAPVEEIAPEIRLDQLPAPRGDHSGGEGIMGPWKTLRSRRA